MFKCMLNSIIKQVLCYKFGTNMLISAQARLPAEGFTRQKKLENHDVRKIDFYDENNLCSTIYADFSDKTLVSAVPLKYAFSCYLLI